MKRKASIILCCMLFLASMMGCENTMNDIQKESKSNFSKKTNQTKMIGDIEADGELTVSFIGFVLDDESDKMSRAKKLYEKLFPNVKFNLEVADFTRVTFEDYFTKLSTEIMSGSGPDVFEITNEPYKMIKAGAYEDLFPYFENDDFFNPDNYYMNVFRGGNEGEFQHFVPTDFYIPIYISTEKLTDEIGLDIAKCKDYISTAKILGQICEENKLDCDSKEIIYGLDFPYIFPARSGVMWLDVSNEMVNLNDENIKPIMEVFKSKLFPHIKINDGSWTSQKIRGREAKMLLTNRSAAVEMLSDGTEGIIKVMRSLEESGETPLIFAWKDVNGKYTAQLERVWAVNSGSKNKENAYQFIKMMISNEFLNVGQENTLSGISVNKSTVEMQLNNATMGESYYVSDDGSYSQFPLSQKYADEFLEILDNVNNAEIPQTGNDILRKHMQPYYEGEKTYDECIKNAQEALEIYVSE